MKSKCYFNLILTILLLSGIKNSDAQAPDWLWTKSIGGNNNESARSIVTDPETGDVFATGTFSGTVDFDPGVNSYPLTSYGSSAIFISKLDRSGNFEWAKEIGGSDMAYVVSMTYDPAGNGDIYITGSFHGTIDFDPGPGTFNLNSTGVADIFIVHLDGSGNFLWVKAMSGPGAVYMCSIAVDMTASGNIYTTGFFRGTIDFDPGPDEFQLTSNGSDDIYISKLDGQGNFVWAISFGGPGSDVCNAITVDPSVNGNVYATGWFSGTVDFDPGVNAYNITSVGRFDIFIIKINSSGQFDWAKQLGGTGEKDGAGLSIKADPKNGDVYTTGYFEGTADFDPGKGIFELTSFGLRDIFISKLDCSGNFKWAITMGGPGLDVGLSITIDPGENGDIYTTGYFHGDVDFYPGPETFNLSSVGPDDIFISKFDVSGNFEWAKAMGGTKEEAANGIALDNSGNVYVAGFFKGPSLSFDSSVLVNAEPTNGTADIFIAKLNTITSSASNLATEASQIEIYPNPVKDKLFITLPGEKLHGITISVFKLTGQVVFSEIAYACPYEYAIDFRGLPAAIYIAEVRVNGQKMTKLIVKVQE